MLPRRTGPDYHRRMPARRAASRGADSAVTRALLFSDLRDYTAFVERYGDASATKLLRDYRATVRREVARHHGAEVKTEGDSFYVVFERPTAALDCAVAIQKRAAARNADDPIARLRIGMGLHAGEVIPHDGQFVGSAVNVAARLAAKAGPGELLVSDTLRGLVRTAHDHRLVDRGSLELKGIAELVHAWSVEWRGDGVLGPSTATVSHVPPPIPVATVAPISGQLLCPVLVGREAAITQLELALERAAQGDAAVLIVGGEAGVGKTALTRELIARAAGKGFRLLSGGTYESSGGLPYGPFVSALRSGFRGHEREHLERFISGAAPGLSQLFPELERAPERRAAPNEMERAHLSVAFQEAFRAFAKDAPLLVVVEDLHWADEASLDLLHALARELGGARVLLYATYRSDELHRRHPLVRTLGALKRERLAVTISLTPLSKEDLGELIRLTFAGEQKVSDEFLSAIYDRCEGNPYFGEELLKSLAESGEIVFDGSGWVRQGTSIDDMRIPDSIVDAVRERIERLSPEAKVTLAAAAVVGSRIPFELLREVRGTSESELEANVRELIEQQLIGELGKDDDAYGFRHALTREVVYDDLLLSERRRLHRAIATALAAAVAAEPALVAHHLLAAGDMAAAIGPLLAAGTRAQAVGAPRESATHFQRALEIGLPEADAPAALEGLAEAYERFDAARAAAVAEEAAAGYRRLGDRRGLSRVLRVAAYAWWRQGDSARSRDLGAAALAAVADDPSIELARAMLSHASGRLAVGDDAEAGRLVQQGLELGERLGDMGSVVAANLIKARVVRATAPAESLALYEQARDLALRSGLPGYAVAAINNSVLSLYQLDRPRADLTRRIEEGLVLAARHGFESPAFLYLFQAWTQWQRGEWDDALETARRADSRSRAFIEAVISMGREAPERARDRGVRSAEAFIRTEGEPITIEGLQQGSYVLARAGDVAAAASWLERLRAYLGESPRRHAALTFRLADTAVLMLAALRCDQPAWLDRIDASVRARAAPIGPWGLALTAAGRAVLAGDNGACIDHVSSFYDGRLRQAEEATSVELVIGVLREAERRAVPLGPAWSPLILRCRAFSERAKATWYLGELDRLTALVAGSA